MIIILEQAEKYRQFAQRKSNAHYLLAERNKNKHTFLGVFVTLFSSIVSTAIFASISSESANLTVQIITGFLSVIAAVLSAFLTFFRFSEISQQHKTAAAAYGTIRHKLDLFLIGNSNVKATTDPVQAKTIALKEMEKIVVKLDEIESTAPTVPDKVWDLITDKINVTPIIHREHFIDD